VGSTLAFVQARTGSSRLPGKVLLKIGGKTILERVIWRLRAAGAVDDVVVLTTTLDEDDAIVLEAERLEAPVHRGPELDVLKRYQQASRRFRPEIVIRATADNPLIDIGSVDRIVRAIHASGLEFCIENGLPVGAATEAITCEALERSDLEASDPAHREHVTLYVKENLNRFRVAFLSPPDALCRPDLRVTVDTPEDFLFVEDLILALPERSRPVPLEHYLRAAEALMRART
jgi:spore coat polysaccharide biosynthesis protein SpsF